jgi:benzodiazapine receptor
MVAGSRHPWLLLAGFLLVVVGGGLAIGAFTRPDAWYAALAKPSFNPPNWLFGPVWTTLYAMIAVAGWRVWIRDRTGPWAMAWWILQLGLNFAWSPLFFGAHRIDLALVVIVLLLASIVGFIAQTWKADRVAALLFLPYAAWVSFASLLNAALWRLNPQA